jgi:hypothetical protein
LITTENSKAEKTNPGTQGVTGEINGLCFTIPESVAVL